jgi:hypothetical protein
VEASGVCRGARYHGGLEKVEYELGCSVLNKFQGFRGKSGEHSQQQVAVVQTGDDKYLD